MMTSMHILFKVEKTYIGYNCNYVLFLGQQEFLLIIKLFMFPLFQNNFVTDRELVNRIFKIFRISSIFMSFV